MGVLSEKLRFGVLKLSTDRGPLYTRPSPWERVYLLWTFRNFRRLPQQVLNPNQQRLVEKLIATATIGQLDLDNTARLIGVVENIHLSDRTVEAGRGKSKLVQIPATPAKLAVAQAAGSEGLSFPVSRPARKQNVAARSTRRPAKLQAFVQPAALNWSLGFLLESLRSNIHRVRAQDWRKWGPVTLLSATVLAVLVSLLVSARTTPRSVPAAGLPKTPASQIQPKAQEAGPPAISPRLPKPSAAVPVGQLQTAANPIRVATAINTPVQPAEAASPALQPRAARDTSSPEPLSNIAPQAAVLGAEQPRLGAIASREEETKGISAVAREVVPAKPSPPPPERVVIAAAPLSFSYPVSPSPKLTGKLSLKVLIAADGSVREARVISGNDALANAAVRAVRKWRYRPVELNGHAAEAETNLTINFAGDDAVSVSFRP